MNPRSYLFVPGNRPDMLAKATVRGADAIIVDLEDAVPLAGKDTARAVVAEWLEGLTDPACQVWVRINNTPDLRAADLGIVTPAVAGVLLPKVDDPAVLDGVGLPVMAMIESGAGWLIAAEIARHPAVEGLVAGEVDLASALGLTPSDDERELLPFRMALVAASAAAGIKAPIGSISTDFRDLADFRRTTESLRRMGFGSRLAIHPAQVPGINDVFTPSPAEVARARALVEGAEAAAGGVFVDEAGRMVDEALIKGARRILELAESISEWPYEDVPPG